jgi:hypothetical protein
LRQRSRIAAEQAGHTPSVELEEEQRQQQQQQQQHCDPGGQQLEG